MIEKQIKTVALKAVSASAEILKKEYYKFERSQIKIKSQHEIITKCDLISEQIIIKEIRKNFPEHRILSEEQGDDKKKSDYLWIIDPIDGTTNFSIHNPLWSVTLSVAYKNEIIFGIILAPILNELFIAEKGKGAFLNGKKIKTKEAANKKNINTFCHSRKISDIKKAIKYYSYQKLHALDCRQMGSASLELAYVACGRVDSILIPGANSWDVGAGALIVQEAGGKVSDFANKKWSLKSSDILAAHPKLHSELIKTVKKLKL